MTVEIHFIWHVANGVHITIHNFDIVYVHLFKYCFPKKVSSNSIFQELLSDDFLLLDVILDSDWLTTRVLEFD